MRAREPQPAKDTSIADRQLHPVLKAAMECLDLSLEAELARYRRERSTKPHPVQRFFIRHDPSADRPEVLLEANSALLAASQIPSALPGSSADQAPGLPGYGDREGSAALPLGLLSDGSRGSEEPGAINLGSDSDLALKDARPLVERSALEVGSMLNVAETERQNRAASRRRARAAARRPDPEPLWSGLGVATILMMISGTIWTYYSNYPASDRWLNLASLWNQAGERLGLVDPIALRPLTAARPNTAEPETSETPLPPDRQVAVVPNLAEKEFVELDLKSLSTLDAQRPRPPAETFGSFGSVAPQTTIGQVPAAPAQKPGSTPTQGQQGQAKTAIAAPLSALGQPVPIITIPADGSRFIYVMGDATTPDALPRARKLVPDAYTRRFGQADRLQFGALNTFTEAMVLAQRVRQGGIPVAIYVPANRIQDVPANLLTPRSTAQPAPASPGKPKDQANSAKDPAKNQAKPQPSDSPKKKAP